MPRVDPVLDNLADAIVDGAPVDWGAARATTDAGAQALLAQLRLLATVADVHRDAIPRTWGHLEIREHIGRGSFGVVYRAYDTRLDREVALKLLPADRAHDPRASAIIREGRLLAKVRHPNVVTIHGAEQMGDRVGLWMEFVRGRTLEQLLNDRPRFSAEEATAIGIEICQAVTAVHAAGLLHRDIKAHNVMRADDGRIVLMDFGTGRDADDTGASDLTGTPLYLAPEVLAGAPATRQSDIYSIGVLLYHLVTGAYPVRGSSVAELRRAHERGARVTLRAARPELPRRLTSAIDRAIDSRPERRHDSVGALVAELRAAAAMPTRRRLLMSAAAVALVVAVLWWSVRGNGAAPRALALAEPPVIAVLPFRNDGAPDTDLFVEGLTYEIMSGLAAIEGIDVTSATSSFAVKDQPRQASSLGRQLGANLLLDGSVLRSGAALRVQAQLVLAADDVVLWSNTFDRRFQDVFAIQDEISLAIVNALRVKLGRGRRYDTNPQIYERYLRARALLRRTGPGTPEVIRILNEVVTADPGFAPAYAAIASAMAKKSYAFPNPDPTNVSPDVANATIRPAAMRAIELDPFLAEAHAAMGIVHSSELDWAGAEKAFRQALTLDSSQTQIHADFVLSTLWPLGRVDQSRDMLAQAVALDPLSPFLRRLYARMQTLTGAAGEALESLKLVRELDPAFGLGFLWEEALVFDGRVQEAIAIMESRGEGWQGVLGYAYAIAGRRTEAEALAAQNADFPQRQVMIFAGLGDADRTFEALDRLAAINARRALCYTTYPELAELRGDPRMAAFRLRYGVR